MGYGQVTVFFCVLYILMDMTQSPSPLTLTVLSETQQNHLYRLLE